MLTQIVEVFNQQPEWVKTATDVAAVGTALGTGVGAFFGVLVTPLAALASLAALVYTVFRTIHLIKHWNKP